MSKNQPFILVTGGAVSIGSHTVEALQNAGYGAIVPDNLVYGHREVVEVLPAKLIVGDISRARLEDIFKTDLSASKVAEPTYSYLK